MSKNLGRWRGQAFWSGVANINTGEIVKVWQFEVAEDADFNLGYLLTGQMFSGWINHDLAFFFFENLDTGALRMEDANDDPIPESVRQRILAQIDIRRPEAV